ncbi:MAG: ABC transporter substrate-binding protein [Desulfuromonadales bacterium]|nr:ABC transporter substrate-binding protein [Desulfuromonadales bacterium]
MRFRKTAAFLASCLLLATGTALAAVGPTEQLRSGVENILTLLNDQAITAESRNQKIEQIVRAHFEFDVMSQWILGIHWRKAAPAERERFKELFTQLLEATYKGRIGEYAGQYTDEQVEYASERIIEGRALVDTFVVTGNRKIPISYKLIQKDQQWKVYDVVIEGVSLVSNYRSTYDEIVRKEGLDGLFSRMEEKISQLRSGQITPEEAIPKAGGGAK